MRKSSLRPPSARTTVRRLREKACYEQEALFGIVDESYVCHVAFMAEGTTHCIPTAHWREGDHLYIHGSNGSRMIKALAAGAQASLAITLLDGLVLAKAAFNHSMNYRSAVIYGQFEVVKGASAKLAALDVFMDKIVPGRKEEARRGNPKELAATSMLRISLAEAAVKISAGGPEDNVEDAGLQVWTGRLPMKVRRDTPICSEAVADAVTPAYVQSWADRRKLTPP